MSSIDERVVNMKFNNSQFESGVKQTTQSLDSLKKGLNLDGATKGLNDLDAAGKKFSLAGMAQGIDTIAGKFSALSIAGITALVNITSKAVDAGLQFAKSFTIQPILSGLQEFETNMNSIQTVLANTSSKGTTLDDVNAALLQLNNYSDKTIYNFSQMARNIGTFTAAGVDLKTSVEAIKGIANLAAVSGSSADQASTAMYQLSQAIATGTVHLMDWNSVVNAGMGGEQFQEALKRTARNHGVAVDDMIKKNGSFRDSLQEDWLTASILTETLSTYTGDLSEAQLKSMGYTDQQTKDIMQMGKTAQDAATKVKTASQLMDTLKEAVGSGWTQTWQTVIGDFAESENLFTNVNNVLSGMVAASANARNALLKDWKDNGGRTAAINAIANAFQAVMAILKPFKDAFAQIFPAMTGKQLADITKGIEAFTKTLIIGGSTANELKRTFSGVFAIFDIGFQVVKQIVVMFAKLFGQATEGAGGFLAITASVGDFFVALDKAVKNGDGLTKFFDGLGKVLSVPITLLRAFVGVLVQIGEGLGKLDFSGFADAAQSVGEKLSPLANLGNIIVAVWSKVGDALQAVWKFFQPVAQALASFFGNLGHTIADSVKTGDFSAVLAVINTGLFAAITVMIKNFLKGGLSVDLGGGLLESIKVAFGGLTDTLKTMQNQIKSKTLINIAIAVGILTASLVALSLIDAAHMAIALGGLSVMMGELVGAMAVLDKILASETFSSGKMIAVTFSIMGLASAMLVMSGAIAILARLDWNELARGVVGVAAAMGIMIGAIYVLSTIPIPALIAASAAIVVGSSAMVIAATGMVILAGAMKIMATMSWDEIGRSMVVMGGGLAILAVGLTLMAGSLIGAASLVVAAAGLLVLAFALQQMAKLSWDDIGRGMVAVGGSLAILAIGLTAMAFSLPGAAALLIAAGALLVLALALQQMAKLSWDDIGRGMATMGASLAILAVGLTAMIVSGPGAAALTIAAAALLILGEALKMAAKMSWDEIGRAMTVLAGSLLILAVGLTAMIVALPGAAALVVAAAALALLTPILITLGGMSWAEIGTGLGALASVLGILAIAGIALIPAIPGLIGLGVAVTLVGIGALAAGVGLLAFSAGLTALSIAGAAGAVGITAILSTIIGLIPAFMEGLAQGIITFAEVLSGAAPTFITAMTTLIMSLLAAINTTGPAIIATMFNLIMALVNQLVINVPKFVDAGLKIITGVLNGIANNLPSVIKAGTNLIIAFINGMQESMNKIADAAMVAVIKFVNGLADSINKNAAAMREAGGRLATAIIDGMTGGLASGVGKLINSAKDMANSALNAAKNLLGIHSPSTEFYDIGGYSTEGLANGLTETSKVVEKAAASVGNTALISLTKSMTGISDKVATNIDINPTITPVLDLSLIKKDAGKVATMLPTPTLKLDRSYDAAVQAVQGSQNNQAAANEPKDDGTPPAPTVVLNQTNNSPKALSSAEIYRQTKNQLSIAKEELDKK